MIISNISPQIQDALVESIESLSVKKQKLLMECVFVNKSVTCKADETNGRVIVPC